MAILLLNGEHATRRAWVIWFAGGLKVVVCDEIPACICALLETISSTDSVVDSEITHSPFLIILNTPSPLILLTVRTNELSDFRANVARQWQFEGQEYLSIPAQRRYSGQILLHLDRRIWNKVNCAQLVVGPEVKRQKRSRRSV
jgi:hypothetical protein